jgi:hypothetical protein
MALGDEAPPLEPPAIAAPEEPVIAPKLPPLEPVVVVGVPPPLLPLFAGLVPVVAPVPLVLALPEPGLEEAPPV